MDIYYHSVGLCIAVIYTVHAAAADLAEKCDCVKRIRTEHESVDNDQKRCCRKT